MKRAKNIGIVLGILLSLAVSGYLIKTGQTGAQALSSIQASVFSAPTQSSQETPYGETENNAQKICDSFGDTVTREGDHVRTTTRFIVLGGMRPSSAESNYRITDTLVCFYDTGETIPFMVTLVGGKIVNVQ